MRMDQGFPTSVDTHSTSHQGFWQVLGQHLEQSPLAKNQKVDPSMLNRYIFFVSQDIKKTKIKTKKLGNIYINLVIKILGFILNFRCFLT